MAGLQTTLPRSRVLRATVDQNGARITYLHAWVSICMETREIRIYRSPGGLEPTATAQVHQADINWRARGLHA